MATDDLQPIRGTLALAAVAAAVACTAGVLADTVTVANFEGGIPAGWVATPNGWTVGGTTGTNPNIPPAQGALFARCGAPNVASEALVGMLTSPPLVVLSSTLTWRTCGWSGQFGTGANRFEILNANLNVVATVAAPLSDLWVTRSVDMVAAGLSVGDTFTFRAIDGTASNSYAWLAVDNIQFTNVTCTADLNGSGTVDGADLGILLANWGAGGPADINGSGVVDGADLGVLLAAWGGCTP